MADYYRKTVNNTANDVKLKMQMAAFALKLSENINKINDLLEVDKNIKKDIVNNSNSIKNINKDVTNNFNRISINDKNIKLKTDAINSNIDEIKSTLDNLDLSSHNKYSIEYFFIYFIEIENSYKLSKDTPRLSISNYNLIDEFKKDNIL